MVLLARHTAFRVLPSLSVGLILYQETSCEAGPEGEAPWCPDATCAQATAANAALFPVEEPSCSLSLYTAELLEAL